MMERVQRKRRKKVPYEEYYGHPKPDNEYEKPKDYER